MSDPTQAQWATARLVMLRHGGGEDLLTDVARVLAAERRIAFREVAQWLLRQTETEDEVADRLKTTIGPPKEPTL